ncbi:MAG: co-chaperone GroES family protein [Cetobacterium sp.]|uniref:co-chaperone GroES family protein n=1 Tax=unclassified Cetobacterium TaxID=2630983 RepID=UPI0006465543|nr:MULTISPECIES: co-chaperone GroES family protein [unclassified Cetobacterium]
MKIKPIGKRVLAEIINLEEKTSTGIILIQNNEEKNYRTGTIISLSDDLEITKQFKINDKIIFSKKSGIKISHSSSEKMLLELDEILGIIEE